MSVFYWNKLRRFPNLRNPRRLSEKIQWYKLYWRNPVMTVAADKYEVRRFVAGRGMGEILNELYGVYDNPDTIDFAGLPGRFVLKANHGSNMIIVCRDKGAADFAEYRRKAAGWLRRNYYHSGCEWAYKDIPLRLVCEKYLENEEIGQLIDYKFNCFNGDPKWLTVGIDRFAPGGPKGLAYDVCWNKLDVLPEHRICRIPLPKPANFDSMVDIVRRLANGFPFVRVDLYSIHGRTVFGEMTFYPSNGTDLDMSDSLDRSRGDLFILPAPMR